MLTWLCFTSLAASQNHLDSLKRNYREPRLLRFWLIRFQMRRGRFSVKEPRVWPRWSVKTGYHCPPHPHCPEWVTGPAASAPAGSVFKMQTLRLHLAGSCITSCCLTRSAGDLCACWGLRSPVPLRCSVWLVLNSSWDWNIDDSL